MSVTFNRAALIKVADAALTAHDTAQANYAKACDEFRAKHAAGFNNERVRELRDVLTAALKRGTPVSRADVRKALGIGDIENLFYVPVEDYTVKREITAPDKYLTPAEVTETRALLQVLRAATGDTVSVNELKLLGLKNLSPVFTAAAQNADVLTSRKR